MSAVMMVGRSTNFIVVCVSPETPAAFTNFMAVIIIMIDLSPKSLITVAQFMTFVIIMDNISK